MSSDEEHRGKGSGGGHDRERRDSKSKKHRREYQFIRCRGKDEIVSKNPLDLQKPTKNRVVSYRGDNVSSAIS